MRSNWLVGAALAVALCFGFGTATVVAAAMVEGNTVTFTLEAPEARSVSLAGTFNNWSPVQTPMEDRDGDGIWTVTLDLADGRYEYKFVINGSVWVEDPENTERTNDGHGGYNSVLYVGSWQQSRAVELSAELINKLEQVGRGSPVSLYNDLIVTVDGAVHTNLDVYGKFKIYQGFQPLEQANELDWAVNWAGLEEGSATVKTGPFSLVGSWKIHAGDSGDPWGLYQANSDEDDFWGDGGYYRTEVSLAAGDLNGRIGFIRGQDRVIFGKATYPVGDVILGVIGTYHRWEDATRYDGQDYRSVYGLYATGEVTEHFGLTAQWLHSKGTRMVVTEDVPSKVVFIMPRYPHAERVTIKGSWDGWTAETPMTRDPATGYWMLTLTLLPGVYEYVYHVIDPSGEVWINDKNGDNLVRIAQSETETFTIENVPEGVTTVYLRGSMPGVGWDRGVPMTPTGDGLWTATVDGLTIGEKYSWKVYYELGGSGYWIGAGDSGVNFTRVVGSSLVEQPSDGNARWVELRYRRAPWEFTLGTKAATESFLAEFSDIGSDFQEHYVTASRKLGKGVTVELGYSLRSAFVSTEATRTHTVTPALIFEDSTQWLDSARIVYAYKDGAEPDDEMTVEATLRPWSGLSLKTKGKVTQDDFWFVEATLEGSPVGKLEASYEDDRDEGGSARVRLERSIVGQLTGSVEYDLGPVERENWRLELIQKLPLMASSELSVAYETAEEKLTIQLKTVF